MQSEDLIDLPVSTIAESEGYNAEQCAINSETYEAKLQERNLEVNNNKIELEVSEIVDTAVVKVDNEVLPATEFKGDLMESSHVMEVCVEVKKVSSVSENDNRLNSRMQSENGCVKESSPVSRQKREGSPVSDSLSDSKKVKLMVDEQQPSVRVMFNFLTRDSKQKLEELLQHWSEWHAKHRSSSHDSAEVFESGEQTYFPALRIGPTDSSAVSVWMDNHSGSQHNKEIAPLDSKSIPLYDRGYSWALTSTDTSDNPEGGMEKIDSSRCFNCGAYDHALRECPKPRDNAAVNNARKEHNSKRNLNANSRNPTRYYQSSCDGKYDGLKPGSLDDETRKLLGLGELDPPPWLNRMREIGYPPGYLDPDNEDQPSGILIFGDEDQQPHKEESEDGEILDTDSLESPPRGISSEPPRKMSVQFPGINAPIPINASESRWSRSNCHDQRWSRYTDLDASFPRERANFASPPMNSSLERSFSDRGRWSPTAHDDSPHHGSYNSRRSSPPHRQSYGSGSSRRWDDDRRNDFDTNYPSRYRDRDRDENHHPYRRR